MITLAAAPPSNGPALLDAVEWINLVVHGSLVVSIATLGIAALGFATLSGRLSARRGLLSILGCFVLFGASSIAHGISSAGSAFASVSDLEPIQTVSNPDLSLSPPQPVQPLNNGDPYAGASIAQ